MRNVLAKVNKANGEMVAAAIRTIFAQPDTGAVAEQFERIIATLEPQFPEVTAMLVDAHDDLLAFSAFPIEHGERSGRPTRSNGCIARSSAAPTSSACFPTTKPSTVSSPP